MNSPKAYDFTLEEVQKLFQMQDELNSYIHPEWKTQGFNWGLAIVDECMEIHGHLGWKWWKKGYQVGLTEENRKQIQLEVIDILHFVVSSDLDMEHWFDGPGKEEARDTTVNCFNTPYTPEFSLEGRLEVLMGLVSAGNSGDLLRVWAHLAHSVGLTKSQILETYTQKYVLNKFRQDHGYKDGTYQKEWVFLQKGTVPGSGVNKVSGEDNYWLEHVVSNIVRVLEDPTNPDLVYAELKALYDSRINK